MLHFCNESLVLFVSLQLVPRPDVVEMHDVTAHDPKFLVFLKVNFYCAKILFPV